MHQEQHLEVDLLPVKSVEMVIISQILGQTFVSNVIIVSLHVALDPQGKKHVVSLLVCVCTMHAAVQLATDVYVIL